MIDICICTYNPRPEILDLVLRSIQRQSADLSTFRLLIIDNGSSPPLQNSILDPIIQSGIKARIVFEPITGLVNARLRAIRETNQNWILFVDDDNELFPDFIAEGIKFIDEYSEVGCFGGKILLPANLKPPQWAYPFLPFLAIKDLGEEPIIGKSPEWQPWEPSGAGAFVNRKLLDEYEDYIESMPAVSTLGHSGMRNLGAGDDSLIMRSAFRFGLACAYNPRTSVYHHLDSSRFEFTYLIKLMYSFGVSDVILESILKGPQVIPNYYKSLIRFISFLIFVGRKEAQKSWAFGLGMVSWHIGARNQHRRQSMSRS